MGEMLQNNYLQLAKIIFDISQRNSGKAIDQLEIFSKVISLSKFQFLNFSPLWHWWNKKSNLPEISSDHPIDVYVWMLKRKQQSGTGLAVRFFEWRRVHTTTNDPLPFWISMSPFWLLVQYLALLVVHICYSYILLDTKCVARVEFILVGGLIRT